MILISSGSGGRGKTTLTAALATAFSNQFSKVCALDACFGFRSLDMALGVENKVVFDAGDLMAGECTMSEALVPVNENGLYLISAPQNKMSEEIDD